MVSPKRGEGPKRVHDPNRRIDMEEFSHLDANGNVRMVDITDKLSTSRVARAEGSISMRPETLSAIQDDKVPKGNVLTTAKIAGINAAKNTAHLIPMCHQLNVSYVDLEFELRSNSIKIMSLVKTKDATGVEMEALTAVSAAALTIYDMCKAVDDTMMIKETKLIEKIGGRSGHATDHRPRVGVITLSDSVSSGRAQDRSGPILSEGFSDAGCDVDHHKVLPDGSDELVKVIGEWIEEGVELILTTGGTGLGKRDLTIEKMDKVFDARLPGIEQALHDHGRRKVSTAMLSRLAAGMVEDVIVICLPGSTGAVKDALSVLIPTIFHSFHVMRGERH